MGNAVRIEMLLILSPRLPSFLPSLNPAARMEYAEQTLCEVRTKLSSYSEQLSATSRLASSSAALQGELS